MNEDFVTEGRIIFAMLLAANYGDDNIKDMRKLYEYAKHYRVPFDENGKIISECLYEDAFALVEWYKEVIKDD